MRSKALHKGEVCFLLEQPDFDSPAIASNILRNVQPSFRSFLVTLSHKATVVPQKNHKQIFPVTTEMARLTYQKNPSASFKAALFLLLNRFLSLIVDISKPRLSTIDDNNRGQ